MTAVALRKNLRDHYFQFVEGAADYIPKEGADVIWRGILAVSDFLRSSRIITETDFRRAYRFVCEAAQEVEPGWRGVPFDRP